MSAPLIPFLKPWKSYDDQVALLEKRGLIVNDRIDAGHFLSHLNYYRFSGYCLAFESSRHKFFPGTTFNQIEAAYQFDLTLRDLLTEALEVIEVDIRGVIAHNFSQSHGPFGHVNNANFHKFDHVHFLEVLHKEANRSSALFIRHFKTTYQEFPNLPVWIATEIAPFGCLSRMFSGMRSLDQQQIARRYGLQSFVLESWMHHFVYVRNLCAHHARLWDRVWDIKATLPAGNKWSIPNHVDNSRLFCTLLMLRTILNRIRSSRQFGLEWKQRIETHLQNPPAVATAVNKMGLTANWTTHPIWMI